MWHRAPSTRLVEPGDTSFWNDLWVSDAFRALISDQRTGYARLLDEASRQPWWWVDGTTAYEKRHFTVWFAQVVVRRHYDNPVLQDLFHWHEVLHALTFRDDPLGGEQQWRLRMRANEITVSLETELLVYWRHRGLRAQSFSFPIWHDALTSPLATHDRQRLSDYRQACLNDPELGVYEHSLYAARPHRGLEHPDNSGHPCADARTLWDLRRATTKSPDRSNAVEAALADYERQSDPFCDGWVSDWRSVEHERMAFANACAEGRWTAAVRRRYEQWDRTADENGVPYGHIARAIVF